jgi:hypothetical protein
MGAPRAPLTPFLAGGYSLTFVDAFVDALWGEERVCDIILPRLAKRQTLGENGDIGPRRSRLMDGFESPPRSRSGSPARRQHWIRRPSLYYLWGCRKTVTSPRLKKRVNWRRVKINQLPILTTPSRYKYPVSQLQCLSPIY